MMDNNPQMQQYPVCKCPHHKMVPIMIVLFALLFLFHAYGYFSDHFVAVAWPVLVLIGGLTKLCGGWCKCCSSMHKM